MSDSNQGGTVVDFHQAILSMNPLMIPPPALSSSDRLSLIIKHVSSLLERLFPACSYQLVFVRYLGYSCEYDSGICRSRNGTPSPTAYSLYSDSY